METLLLAGIGLLALSLLLVVLEAFVPSGGVIGVVAAACAVTGVVALFRFSAIWGVSGLLTMLVLGPMSFVYAFRQLPNTPLGRKIVGPTAEEIAEQVRKEDSDHRESRLALMDARGTALTDLRPIGVVEIDGQRYDAAAEGGLIDRGSAVRVTGVDGLQIRVRATA